MYTQVHIRVQYIYNRARVRVRVCVRVCLRVSVCVGVWVCASVCVRVCVGMLSYIHVHGFLSFLSAARRVVRWAACAGAPINFPI